MGGADNSAAILTAINHLSNSIVEMREEQYKNLTLLARAADVRALRGELVSAKEDLEASIKGKLSVADCVACRANLVDKRTFKAWGAAFCLFGPLLTAMFVIIANHYLNSH